MGKREAAVPVPFYVCRRPDFDEVLDDCDRPLLEWIESVPVAQRTPPMTRERQRIVTETHAARDSALAQCEASRYASRGEDDGEPHLHVAITSRLDGRRGRSSTAVGDSKPSAQVTVSFSPDQACGPVPFEVLHRLDKVFANLRMDALSVGSVDVLPGAYTLPPLDGEYLQFVVPADGIIHDIWVFPRIINFSGGMGKLLDLSAEYAVVDSPPPPAELLGRSESFDVERVDFIRYGQVADDNRLSVSVYIEMTHETTGAVLSHIFPDIPFTTSQKFDWPAGISLDRAGSTSMPVGLPAAAVPDGWWRVRMLMGRPVGALVAWATYGGAMQTWSDFFAIQLGTMGAPLPVGGIALWEGRYNLFKTGPGAGKALLRVISWRPEPSIGTRVAFRLVSPTQQSLSLRSRAGVTRDLPPYTESDTVYALIREPMIAPSFVALSDGGFVFGGPLGFGVILSGDEFVPDILFQKQDAAHIGESSGNELIVSASYERQVQVGPEYVWEPTIEIRRQGIDFDAYESLTVRESDVRRFDYSYGGPIVLCAIDWLPEGRAATVTRIMSEMQEWDEANAATRNHSYEVLQLPILVIQGLRYESLFDGRNVSAADSDVIVLR
ncbi:MAG: hypothetical protein H3C26_07320 [Rhodocyclaceae bacterium]|nr:hypothetical protein [Rhodocyclaceae bacterium]